MSNTNNTMGCKKKETPKVTNVPVKELQGVTYFKLISSYPGDYTKHCGLLGTEIDENFYFLRGNDISTAYTEVAENRKYLVLVRLSGEEIRVDITEEKLFDDFYVEDGYIYVRHPGESEYEPFKDKESGNPVRFLVEGQDVHIVTDSSIQGDGSYGKPIGVDLAYRAGTLEPAEFFVDLTCPEASIDMISGIGYSHAIVTKENVSRFGALYTWDQAMKMNDALVREGRGWRVPTSEDWGKLLNWAEGDCEDCKKHITEQSGNFGCIAGYRLKSKEFWKEDESAHTPVDDFGFAVYPVGVCPEVSNTAEPTQFGFEDLYKVSTFWSSSKAQTGEIYVRTFSYGHDDVAQFTEPKKKRFSLRLVRDIDGDFDIAEYAEILGEFVPVMLTTDGKQLWTSVNVGLVSYEGYDEHEVTVPEEWKDVNTDVPAYKFYEKKEDEGEYSYKEIGEELIPSYAEIEYFDELPVADEDSPEYVAVEYIIHLDMVSEAKFYYNAWDGDRWHKRLLREGESVVLLHEDFPNPCDTAATPYVTEENKSHEWRIYVNEQTGLDELIDTLEALKGEFREEFKKINESISALTEDLESLSGSVEEFKAETESAFTSAFTAIDEAKDEIDAIEEAIGLTSGGTYIVPEKGLTSGSSSISEAIAILDKTILDDELVISTALNELNDRVTKISGDVESLQNELADTKSELDNAENAVGLAEDGSYVKKSGTFCLDDATSVEEEIAALDKVASAMSEAIEELQDRSIEAADASIVVEAGHTTTIRVNIDPEDEHIKLGDDGLWFDGDFGEVNL